MTLGRNAKQVKHTIRNLVSSLIIHEHVSTTPAKAKLAASYLENLITKCKDHTDSKTGLVDDKFKHLLYGQLYNQNLTVGKLCDTLNNRYSNRSSGFTRMIKLESRFGDNAPQVALELVDNHERELMFWYVAKIVARLELQNLPLDPLTKKNRDKVISYKEDGLAKFNNIVQVCKDNFFNEEQEDAAEVEGDEEVKSNLENKPRMKSFKNGYNRQTTNFEFVKRE